MDFNVKKILYLFLAVHLILWTAIPSIVNNNLPLDTIEALAWGNELKLGYDKYPPIFPLFTELFFKIFGSQDWAYYFLSQIFIILTFLTLFEFSKYFFKNDFFSLILILLLECIYFFNYTSPELNAFIPLLLFLSVTALFCWKAVVFNKNFDWIIFGFFAAISTLTYYLALYLLSSLVIYFILEIYIKKKINYKYFLALLTYFFILSPHLYFLFITDFKSIDYALFRSFGDPLSGLSSLSLVDNLLYPLIFLIKQILILIPFLFLLRLATNKYKIKIDISDKKLIFLFTIAFLPIILMFLTSLVGGIRVRTMWMTTFYLFPTIFFVYIFKSEINFIKFKRFITIYSIIFLSLPILYAADSLNKADKRTDFPGNEIAEKIQLEWDNNFSNKIEIVAGKSWVFGGWYAGNLSYHLKDRPKLRYELIDTSSKLGTIWIDELDSIKKCNGILLKIDPYFQSCLVGQK